MTLAETLGGLALLFAFVLISWLIGKRANKRPPDGALAFIWLWLGVSAYSFYGGVEAGYSVALEAGVHAVIFGVPAGVGWYLSRRLRRDARTGTSIHPSTGGS